MKLIHVLDAMRNGAVLRLSFGKHTTSWELDDGVTAIWISNRTVQAAIKRQVIAGVGDTLFDSVPSQTWRYIEPASKNNTRR